MSGLLADLYSAGDRMKRKLGGLLSDPMGTIALGSQRMAEDTNALTRLVSEAGYMPNTVNRADQSVLVSERQKALARALLAEKATEMGGAMMGATKFVYPQEQALLTAQRNAAKPISEGGLGLRPNNTPAERAAAMGFDMPAAHFSRHGVDVQSLDSGKYAIAPFDAVGTHVGPEMQALDRFNKTVGYKVGNPDYANDVIKASTYPVQIKRGREMLAPDGKPYQETPLSMLLSKDADYGNLRESNAALREKIFSKHDSIPYANEVESAGQISYIAPPQNIRSRFAAFDPMRRDSPDLLAGALPFTTMADEDMRNKLMQLLQRNGVPIK